MCLIRNFQHWPYIEPFDPQCTSSSADFTNFGQLGKTLETICSKEQGNVFV